MTGQPPPGAQQERTMLAWRRTTLSYVVVELFVAKVALDDGASGAVVLSAGCVVFALWLVLTYLRRGPWTAASVAEPRFALLLRDGRLPALVSVVAGASAVAVTVLAVSAGT
ncbi:DUF202 domain-containing protein [Aeromicrobium terrae]|nr:DUF202 domain-containing protein [Aeromicrobium terrae]